MSRLLFFYSLPRGKQDDPVTQFLRLITYAQQPAGNFQACAALAEDGSVAFFVEHHRGDPDQRNDQ